MFHSCNLVFFVARFVQILSSVQSQLEDLRLENSISRRRVRELEMELDVCKQEVARERTRLFEREESDAHRYMDPSRRSGLRNKGKGKATEGPPEITDDRLHTRYTEAVEEEKGMSSIAPADNSLIIEHQNQHWSP